MNCLRISKVATTALLAVGLLSFQDPKPETAAKPTTYAVVVHTSNKAKGTDEKLRKLVQQILLRRRGEWPDSIGGKKTKAKPFDRDASSREHTALRTVLLEMTSTEFEKHWLSVKQRSGKSAPRAVSSDRLLAKFIAKYPGAVGVMKHSAAQKHKGKLRVLLTFDYPTKNVPKDKPAEGK